MNKKLSRLLKKKKSSEANTKPDKGNKYLTVFVVLAISALIWFFLPDRIKDFLSWKENLSKLLFNSFNRLGIDQLYGTTLFSIAMTLTFWNNFKNWRTLNFNEKFLRVEHFGFPFYWFFLYTQKNRTYRFLNMLIFI